VNFNERCLEEEKRRKRRDNKKVDPNDGGPAFPSHGSMGEVAQEGMSLRVYLASQAMIGLAQIWARGAAYSPASAAVDALKFADAMIVELEKS